MDLKMTRSKWLLGIIGLILIVGALVYRGRIAAAGQASDDKSSDPVSRITRYSLKGKFDEALQEGHHALKSDPGNPAILNQMAMICLIRAKKEPAQQGEWIREGAEYAQEAAISSSDKGPMAIGYVIQAGRSLELAGDLSNDKCTYYRKALDVLENRAPTVKGDSITVNGEVISLAPVLDQKAKTIAEIQKKLADARCDK
jgi:hypothetical protein